MSSHTSSAALPEGYQLHWYEFLGVLGRGGYGITYLALDKNLDRKVAIKEYLPNDFAARKQNLSVEPLSGEQGDLFRWGLKSFLKEAKTLAKFNHPNIVRVLSVFEHNNTAYMVMEYEQGDDLSTLYRNQNEQFDEKRLLDIFVPILDGLALVHKEGFIHRDIKPANIFIRHDHSPVLLDFGSARQTVGNKTQTLTSLVTYGYAPFEQYNEGGGKQGPWTDIYALGATLYFGIVGRKPEDALNRGGFFINSKPDPYEPVSVIAAKQFSPNFLLAIDNALIFKAEARPQNVLDWVDMLLGKTKAPPLPAYMLERPKDDEMVDTTIIMTPTESVEREGLIDVSGRRSIKSSVEAQGQPKEPLIATEQLSEEEIFGARDFGAQKFGTQQGVQDLASKSDGGQNAGPKQTIAYAPEYEKSDLNSRKQFKWPLVAGAVSTIIIVGVLVITNLPTINRTPVPQTSAQRVSVLLTQAETALKAGRLFLPEGSAAVYRYMEVLKIDPSNSTAQKGLDEILNYLSQKISDSIVNGDTVQSEALVQVMEELAPNSEITKTAKRQIENGGESKTQFTIKSLLAEARSDFVAGRIVSPTSNSALSKYKRVLDLDPNNSQAQTGIKELMAYYKKLAYTNLERGNLKKAELNVANMGIVQPRSAEILPLRREIQAKKEKVEQNQKMEDLIAKAEQEMKLQNFYSKTGVSAYQYYRRVLELRPKNKLAINGIKAIQKRLEFKFNRWIRQSDLKRAEQVLSSIAVVGLNSEIHQRAKQKFETLNLEMQAQQSKQQEELNPLQPSRPGVEIAGELMGKYKVALEKRRMREVQSLSEFLPGRKEFIQQFLTHYKSFDVRVTGFKYIARERKASANVQLTKLIDNSGYSVRPGAWGSFGIEIKQNASGNWRVYW